MILALARPVSPPSPTRLTAMRYISLALVLLATPVFAQAPGDSTAYAVPFASSGNTLELVVANAGSGVALDSVTVRLVAVPAWLHFAQPAVLVGQIAPGDEAVAAFSFGLDRNAPVGEAGEALFEITDTRGVVQTKAVRLRAEAPRALALEAAYPNPLRTSATLAFELPAEGHVRLLVVDVLGREVARLLDEPRPAGREEVVWQASGMASGVYVCRLVAEDGRGQRAVEQRRVTVVR